jgi:hypothetical protein
MGESYAASVIEVLRPHFPETVSTDADVLTWWIGHQGSGFATTSAEFIVDDVASARWRLYPHPDDPRRVRLACFRSRPSESDAELERTVNEALSLIAARTGEE